MTDPQLITREEVLDNAIGFAKTRQDEKNIRLEAYKKFSKERQMRQPLLSVFRRYLFTVL